eukprot:TRINITY_DN51069_c0_g1_i5.p1 TRINITY_DN51069_c0_g1~~TRINITY_DN51069_c0_g1_i5.p1  ORF type:complete len:454 (-),score=44.70 TRINITY_DN51069_c0_g1_i5:20-1381(-)
MRSECEDGRDETEHCSFSSADCQGLVALCNRCYSFVRDVDHNAMEMGSEYCHLLGGRLALPKCLVDWYSILQNMTTVRYKMFADLWVGLFINDMSLPKFYRQVIVEGRTALYHFFSVYGFIKTSDKRCLATGSRMSYLNQQACSGNDPGYKFGSVCEFQTNQTQTCCHSKAISLIHTHFALAPGQQSFTVCGDGHVTHTFLLCGWNQMEVCSETQSPYSATEHLPCVFDSRDDHVTPSVLFKCNDEITTLPHTLICNFVSDCQDESDETFCKHPLCIGTFACSSGECVPYRKVCDLTMHCLDNSDEQNCETSRPTRIKAYALLSPALVSFDGIGQLVATKMEPNESCPDTHYRCQGNYNDCLPVYTRCNTMYDCMDHQDEEGCEEMTCPGFFRCRVSTTCVHSNHLCDGWAHCPMHDDELACNVTCPRGCQCQGHTFLCYQPFSAVRFPCTLR